MNIPSVKNPRACAPFVFFFFFFFPPRSVHRTFHFASLENTNPSIHLINSTQCNQSINQSIEYMYQTPRSKTSSEKEKRKKKDSFKHRISQPASQAAPHVPPTQTSPHLPRFPIIVTNAPIPIPTIKTIKKATPHSTYDLLRFCFSRASQVPSSSLP